MECTQEPRVLEKGVSQSKARSGVRGKNAAFATGERHGVGRHARLRTALRLKRDGAPDPGDCDLVEASLDYVVGTPLMKPPFM